MISPVKNNSLSFDWLEWYDELVNEFLFLKKKKKILIGRSIKSYDGFSSSEIDISGLSVYFVNLPKSCHEI